MADVGAHRTDSPLIKHLAQTMILKVAEVYNGLPLFVMPDGADGLAAREQDLLVATPEELPFLLTIFFSISLSGQRAPFDASE